MGKQTVGVVFAALVLVSWFALAGDLEPPAAPASTMKTLEQAEPRIPVSEADLPLTINSSGSYYVTESMTAVGSGISVAATTMGVTIDLMGFTLSGGTGDGIICGNGSGNVTIRNGTVSGFAGDGINCGGADRVVVTNVRVDGNDGKGIETGKNSFVSNCTATNNGFHGIEVRDESFVIGNLATGNGAIVGGGSGIRVTGKHSRIEGNHLISNDQGIRASGAGDVENFIVRNTAGFFNITAGNYFGTRVATEADMNAAANDLVNFDF